MYNDVFILLIAGKQATEEKYSILLLLDFSSKFILTHVLIHNFDRRHSIRSLLASCRSPRTDQNLQKQKKVPKELFENVHRESIHDSPFESENISLLFGMKCAL